MDSSWLFTKLDDFLPFDFFQSLNNVDVNRNLRFLIKSGYYIVPSSSTTLFDFILMYFIFVISAIRVGILSVEQIFLWIPVRIPNKSMHCNSGRLLYATTLVEKYRCSQLLSNLPSGFLQVKIQVYLSRLQEFPITNNS